MTSKRTKLRAYFVKFLGFSTLLSVLLGFVVAYVVFVKLNVLSSDMLSDLESLSKMGEFFGGIVGPIWALAGVILFYLALIYQRKELELQREELFETRKIMDSQSQTIEIQQFENTYFKLLEFHLAASSRIESQEAGNGFEVMYKAFTKAVNDTKKRRKKDGSSEILDEEAFETCFRQVYDSYRNTISHYMESYKSLIYLVAEKSKDPNFYINIIKPHLTEQEVLLQFYYLITYNKDEKFKEIVENYGLFERLNFRSVQAIDRLHLDELKKTAYQPTKLPTAKKEEKTED
ncbi:MAG: putative phage abortive infection protein [Reichenbachiella sp.]|uniref:putative phage abortive infection protein n=1 Tax=Reichenbachiella sp. TaxID=2184521 RepID=UPI00296731C2|nr:putative phage abortive infection protein [Reichenbachiella sp.]MDW3210079.1 putative phage abortive infection protein [Reichenbachiella sp.]